ncbi:MAG TPA: MerR family transcriptional regulator [Solirubrobacteraceae bacterium]|jgi:DNA-binding transcriptional MerR regulator|nr:MerR family transcriptional regulator [Solirubrobacteraceae bacterium]
MTDATLTIGEVAGQAGTSASAIRYYERIGVLPDPDRVSGQRRYTPAAIERLELLKAAKRAGFTLEETRLLFGDHDAGTPAHDHVRTLAEQKLPEVDALIEHATQIRELLARAADCHAEHLDECTVLQPRAPARG